MVSFFVLIEEVQYGHLSDIPKKNITIDKKVNYYNTSMLDEVKDLSIKLSNSFSLENFQTRNEELKKIIIDFFQGKI